MSQPNPSTIRNLEIWYNGKYGWVVRPCLYLLETFWFWQPRGLRRESITRLLPVISLPATSLVGTPIFTKTNNNSYNVSTCLFFLWSESRAIVWIQHFQGGLHFKHYLHTIGKFRVIPWSKIKTVRTFVSFTERFTGSFQWVPGLQKKITHITPLFQSQVLVFQLIV